ncbi:MAG: hypothetical protein CFE43_00560 [Burkholderiales bacterium PBB3]|nr:MAG: hypothetical protein CFE43_00560 [Burkholderiales bacterium PBB3]
MDDVAGRSCPLRYRYGADAIAAAPLQAVSTLYVVGGLYGNLQALDALEHMAQQEPGPVTVCFNGDFNWFNADAAAFEAINTRVLQHSATLGNVEAELGADGDAAGCGCAYPDDVDNATVERSNRIHARLKQVANGFPGLQRQLGALPMFARFLVGDCRMAVVHGDADSLAGWQFDVKNLRASSHATPNAASAGRAGLMHALTRAGADVFASSHTCQPALWSAGEGDAAVHIINNGAAGMPNFQGIQAGLITRISVHPSPHRPVYGARRRQVFIDALPVYYDAALWQQRFLGIWPEGSDAHLSYFARIQGNTRFTPADALCRAG